MKRLFFGICIIIFSSAFIQDEGDTYQPVRNPSFTRGEEIHFKMTYGFFNVGKGSAKIHPDYFRVNGRDCFKVDVSGKTAGMVDWVADVNDQWGA
jgi:hypothetical protein